MKIAVLSRKHTARVVPCILAVLLLNSGAELHATSTSVVHKTLPVHYKDSIVVEKQVVSKKYKIKLYPNANQQVLFFSASGADGLVYQLYLFDMDGRLVKQANIRNKQTTVINIIDKGIYFFEIFIEDTRIENGTVLVK